MRWISKGLVVLEAIGSTMDCPTIAKLSAVTGLSRAAVGRCLYTLFQLGYAAKVDGQGYAAKAGLSIHPYRTPRSITRRTCKGGLSPFDFFREVTASVT